MQSNPKSADPDQLASLIVERVAETIMELLPTPRVAARWKDRRTDIYTMPGTTAAITGREREVEAVLASLRQHGAAVIWGGPGEGKATVAMAAAFRLYRDLQYLSTFEVDMRGGAATVACRIASETAMTAEYDVPSCRSVGCGSVSLLPAGVASSYTHFPASMGCRLQIWMQYRHRYRLAPGRQPHWTECAHAGAASAAVGGASSAGGEHAKDGGLGMCQQHAAAALAPWYIRCKVRCTPIGPASCRAFLMQHQRIVG